MSIQSEIEDKIKRWIVAEQWSYEIVKDPNFHFLCSISDGQNIVFVGIEKRIDSITIHYTADMTPEDQQSYKLSREKYDFWFDSRLVLCIWKLLQKQFPALKN